MPVVRNRNPILPYIWIVLALMVSFGIYFGIKWGLKPKPIPVINPSKFDSLEQIGTVTYRRLRQALRQEKLAVIGSAPWLRDYERFWNGFIAAARQDKWEVKFVFEDPALRPIKDFPGLQRRSLSWPDATQEMVNDLKKTMRFGQLILVHTTFNHSAHRGEISLVKELEAELKRPLVSFTMLSYAVTPEELERIQPPCMDEVAPGSRKEYAACAAVRISRRYMRKKHDPMRYWAAIERHGLKDYFIFIHEPATGNLEAPGEFPAGESDVPAPVDIPPEELNEQ
jgi:hypothetical protein